MAHPGKEIACLWAASSANSRNGIIKKASSSFLQQSIIRTIKRCPTMNRGSERFLPRNDPGFLSKSRIPGTVSSGLAADDADRNMLAYMRKDRAGNKHIWSRSTFPAYQVRRISPRRSDRAKYKVVFNTDQPKVRRAAAELTKRVLDVRKGKQPRQRKFHSKSELPKLTCVYLAKQNALTVHKPAVRRSIAVI